VKIQVKLFAGFRDNRFFEEFLEFPDKTTVGQVIENLSINRYQVGLTLLNGFHCQLNTELAENDSLGIFPMTGGR